MCGIVSQASSSNKLSCMIDADHTATSLVSGSRRFSLVIDKVITFTMSVTGSRSVHCAPWHRKSVMSCVERLGSVRLCASGGSYCAPPVNRTTHVELYRAPCEG